MRPTINQNYFRGRRVIALRSIYTVRDSRTLLSLESSCNASAHRFIQKEKKKKKKRNKSQRKHYTCISCKSIYQAIPRPSLEIFMSSFDCALHCGYFSMIIIFKLVLVFLVRSETHLCSFPRIRIFMCILYSLYILLKTDHYQIL